MFQQRPTDQLDKTINDLEDNVINTSVISTNDLKVGNNNKNDEIDEGKDIQHKTKYERLLEYLDPEGTVLAMPSPLEPAT